MNKRARYVAGFMFGSDAVNEGMVAVVKKCRPEWQAGRFNGIGGHIEAGETAREAMVREFREEAGMDTLQRDWTPYAKLHGSDFVVEFFFAYGDLSKLETKTDEEIYRVYPTEITTENAIPNLTWLVPMALSMAEDRAAGMVIEERYALPVENRAPRVYLSGGIAGLTADQCNSWRAKAKELLRAGTLDPMRHDYSGRRQVDVREIVDTDLRDIDCCDALLVKADVPSWGTAMEVRYAYQLGKPVIAFGVPNVSSAWLEHHSDAIFPNIEDACERLNRILSSTGDVHAEV